MLLVIDVRIAHFKFIKKMLAQLFSVSHSAELTSFFLSLFWILR